MATMPKMRKAEISVDRNCRRTLTDQLTDALRSAIYSGKWKEGDSLPTREALMVSCGVSRNVVQAAVSRLVAEGLVCSRTRLGCKVMRSSRRVTRGRVLEIVTGSETPYWSACFSSTLHEALYKAHINCASLGLYYDRHDRFDDERLEHELLRYPDIVVVKASNPRAASIQKFLDRHDVPYVMVGMIGASARGRHPRMLCSYSPTTCHDFSEFVADCVRAKVRSVTWFACTSKERCDPRAALEKAGMAVETQLANRLRQGEEHDLGGYMAAARDCMLERLGQGALCDLLFIADDYLAMGAIPALLESGVRIPEDVRLVTHYNRGFGPILTKSIARFETDPAAYAREIAHGIVEWLKTDRFPALALPSLRYVRGDTFPVPQ